MCGCKIYGGKPTINGEPGYSWDGKTTSIYHPNPPALADGDELLCDEPGRCGGLDSHSHHLRLVKSDSGPVYLLVRHGGGDERHTLGLTLSTPAILAMDSNTRYWMLATIYHSVKDAADNARRDERTKWYRAAYEGRIKVDRRKRRDPVSIEPETVNA